MEIFVVNGLTVLLVFAFGVAVGQWVVPIPWKFPNWSKQIVVNKIACSVVIVCAVILVAYHWCSSQNVL